MFYGLKSHRKGIGFLVSGVFAWVLVQMLGTGTYTNARISTTLAVTVSHRFVHCPYSAHLSTGLYRGRELLSGIWDDPYIIVGIPAEPGPAPWCQPTMVFGPLSAESGSQECRTKYTPVAHKRSMAKKSFSHTSPLTTFSSLDICSMTREWRVKHKLMDVVAACDQFDQPAPNYKLKAIWAAVCKLLKHHLWRFLHTIDFCNIMGAHNFRSWHVWYQFTWRNPIFKILPKNWVLYCAFALKFILL